MSMFDVRFKKLSDLLIPLDIFNHMVLSVEGACDFYANVTLTDPETHTKELITDDCYVVPYPFHLPVDVHMKAIMPDLNGITYDHVKAWKRQISARASPFTQHFLQKEAMDSFDANDDYGVIISMSSGQMVFFDYSCVTDLHCNIYPEGLTNLIINLKKLKSIPDDIARLQNINKAKLATELYAEFTSKYYTEYEFTYSRMDVLNESGGPILGTASPYSLLGLPQASTCTARVISEFKDRQKIILTV